MWTSQAIEETTRRREREKRNNQTQQTLNAGQRRESDFDGSLPVVAEKGNHQTQPDCQGQAKHQRQICEGSELRIARQERAKGKDITYKQRKAD
jgi:hypothetical protein